MVDSLLRKSDKRPQNNVFYYYRILSETEVPPPSRLTTDLAAIGRETGSNVMSNT